MSFQKLTLTSILVKKMPEQPLVSIITPSYNQVSYLEETISSVLAQDYPHIEYWIIDGGSTDGSVQVIKDHAHQLQGWVSEPDAGQGEAINKGFKRISGEIVAWLNSDDLYRPGAVSRAVSVLQEHPEVGLVYSDVDSIDAQGEVFNRMTYGDYQLTDLLAFNIIGQASVFFRRSLLERVGCLDTSYQFLLDHHLWLRMALHTKLKYVPGEVWAAARIHPGAKNVAAAAQFGDEAYRLADWMLHDDRFQPYIRGQVNRIWAGAHRLNAFYLLDGGERCSALRSYWRGFCRYPPAVLKDWRRIAFALSPIPLDRMRALYLERRKRIHQKEEK